MDSAFALPPKYLAVDAHLLNIKRFAKICHRKQPAVYARLRRQQEAKDALKGARHIARF